MIHRDQLIGEIMVMVSGARDQRLRPHEIQKVLAVKYAVPLSSVKRALESLVEREKLVFTYRDPCSFVEIPCADVNSGVRSLKVVVDDDGESWICDADVDPSMDLPEMGCWRCKDLGSRIR